MIKSTSEIRSEKNSQNIFREESYRWVVVILGSFFLIVNGIATNALVPILSKLTETYEISEMHATLPVMLTFLVYSLSNFPASHMVDKRGLRFGYMVAAPLYMVGLLLYTFINYSYNFVIAGSILISLGQPFIVNSPAKIATFWFTSRNRPFATSILTISGIIGTGIGFLLPVIVIEEKSSSNLTKIKLQKLYQIQFAVCVICCLLSVWLMKSTPDSLPSRGAKKAKANLSETIQIIKTDSNIRLFVLAYLLTYGSVVTFGSLNNLIMKPYGFNNIQITSFALGFMCSGILGSLALGYYLKMTLNYRLGLRGICCLVVICMISTTILLVTEKPFVVIAFSISLLGFCFLPMIPLCYDLACEIAFPIGEAQLIGLINTFAFIFTFITSLIFSSFVKIDSRKSSETAMFCLIGLMAVGSLLFMSVDIHLKRREHEAKGQSNEDRSFQLDLTSNNFTKQSSKAISMNHFTSQSKQYLDDAISVKSDKKMTENFINKSTNEDENKAENSEG